MSSPRPKVVPILLLLCLGALGLRLQGLDFLLPHRMEPDGEIVAQVRLLDAQDRDEDWQFGTYGLLVAYTASLLPDPAPPSPGLTLEQHLAISSAEVVRVRLVVAWLSLLLVPLAFLLAREALGRGASLFAAALAATSLLDLSMAQQARPHAVAAAFYLLSVLASLRLRRKPTWGWYALAGLAAGLAIGVLHSGISVLIPLVAAHLLRERDGQAGRTSFWRALLPAGIVAALVVAFYPFAFSESISGFRLDEQGDVLEQSGHVIDLSLFNGGGFAKVLWTLWSYEPTLLLLGLAGLAVAVRRLGAAAARERRRDLWVALAFPLPYLAAIGAFEGTQERFVLPLIPWLAVLGAFALDALLRWAGERPQRRLLASAAAAALLAFPAWMAWRLSSVRAADDTFEVAARWIEENLAPDDRVLVVFPIQLPLFHDAGSLEELREVIPDRQDFYPIPTRWLRYELYRSGIERASGPSAPARWHLALGKPGEFDPERPGPSTAERVAARGATHAVVELFPPLRELPGDARQSDALRAAGRRLARIAPWRDPDSSDRSFEYEGLPSHPEAHVVGYLLRAERVGPVLEILAFER